MRVGSTLEQLLKEYPNDVRVAYKQHPLPMHSNAMIAAEAAMAANAQGKFLEMHQKLMENSRQLSRDRILELATLIGLDVERFTKDVDAHAHRNAIDQMVKEAMDLGATGTPASFVNGRFLSGAQPYDSFKQLVEEELAKAKKEVEAKKEGGGS